MSNNTKWFFYSVLGLVLIGFGLSVLGEAIIKNTRTTLIGFIGELWLS